MCPPPHSSQQMQGFGVLPSMEVRERASHLREMRVRARHGEDVEDAENQGRTREVEAEAGDPSNSQNCQCLTEIKDMQCTSEETLVFVATIHRFEPFVLQAKAMQIFCTSVIICFCYFQFWWQE